MSKMDHPQHNRHCQEFPRCLFINPPCLLSPPRPAGSCFQFSSGCYSWCPLPHLPAPDHLQRMPPSPLKEGGSTPLEAGLGLGLELLAVLQAMALGLWWPLIAHAAQCCLAAGTMAVKSPQSCPNYSFLLQARSTSSIMSASPWGGGTPGVSQIRIVREAGRQTDRRTEGQKDRWLTWTWTRPLPRSGND